MDFSDFPDGWTQLGKVEDPGFVTSWLYPSIDFQGIYRQCSVCQAPIVKPFPAHWNLEYIKEGPRSGPVDTYVMPHTDTCTAPDVDPDPGLAVRVKGSYVHNVGFEITP
jgi:hypothetical protein